MSDLEDLIYERDEEIKRLQHKLADSVIERGDLTKELERLHKVNSEYHEHMMKNHERVQELEEENIELARALDNADSSVLQ
jgi:uncharacterized coiled-coil DUF342 family protein